MENFMVKEIKEEETTHFTLFAYCDLIIFETIVKEEKIEANYG